MPVRRKIKKRLKKKVNKGKSKVMVQHLPDAFKPFIDSLRNIDTNGHPDVVEFIKTVLNMDLDYREKVDDFKFAEKSVAEDENIGTLRFISDKIEIVNQASVNLNAFISDAIGTDLFKDVKVKSNDSVTLKGENNG